MTNAEPREEVIVKMREDASIKTRHCKNFAWHRHRQTEIWNSNYDGMVMHHLRKDC